ncbi:MAG TPA: DUF4436 family protein, partial [Pyrinomonadaceae bacterium]|nr:DUF4436 family protein [Pyrinomonadaceae bacterium]
ISMKLLGMDAIKGDATARIEFTPKGSLVNAADSTLLHPLKFYINSANGKQEIDFPKGKRMTPVEAVINTYDGNVTDYPFDEHKAEVELYLTPGKEDEKKAAEKPPAANHAGEESADAKKDEAPEDISITVDFIGSLPGYKIAAQNSKDSDPNYVLFNVDFDRSPTAVFFSIFIATMMWCLSIAVLFLVLSIVIRKRKPEISMFSFMASLLFAFYAVRNSQPNVPPIGVFSDFIAFFWAEIIVAACLLISTFTWIFRSSKS